MVPRCHPAPDPKAPPDASLFHQSRNRTSCRARARMTRVAACEPELPPLGDHQRHEQGQHTALAISASKKPIAVASASRPRTGPPTR